MKFVVASGTNAQRQSKKNQFRKKSPPNCQQYFLQSLDVANLRIIKAIQGCLHTIKARYR